MQFKFTDDQRAEHHLVGEVSMDISGSEVLVGLDLDETKFILACEARGIGENTKADNDRYSELIRKSWAARKTLLNS